MTDTTYNNFNSPSFHWMEQHTTEQDCAVLCCAMCIRDNTDIIHATCNYIYINAVHTRTILKVS